jgi:MoaA/NifB/PqqE/SkfB family radical SAM enzyme
MTITQSLYHTFRRYRTLQTDRISALPVVILMPHSACNCRCVMCDIWKDNKNLKQLTENDIKDLLHSLKKLGTQQVVMSGGEALLNPHFFTFCKLLNGQNIKVTLLSTGLTLEKHTEPILQYVNDVIVSLDGNEEVHNFIRNIPDAFQKLRQGVKSLKESNPAYKVTARTVIHRLNFRHWSDIIGAAKEMGIDQVSFLPADVSSHAFNREVLWSEKRQHEILPDENEIEELNIILEKMFATHKRDFDTGFIAESPDKLRRIYRYYAAFYGQYPFLIKNVMRPGFLRSSKPMEL